MRGTATAKLRGQRVVFEWNDDGPVDPVDPFLAAVMEELEGQAVIYAPTMGSMLVDPANWKSYIAVLMGMDRLTAYDGPSIIPSLPPGVVG
jgi:hypothetical protein